MGTFVQTKTVASHHLQSPWQPIPSPKGRKRAPSPITDSNPCRTTQLICFLYEWVMSGLGGKQSEFEGGLLTTAASDWLPKRFWAFSDTIFVKFWHPHYTKQTPIRNLSHTFHKPSIHLMTPHRHPPKALQTSLRCAPEAFQTLSRHCPNPLPTPSRHPPNFNSFETSLKNVPNTF